MRARPVAAWLDEWNDEAARKVDLLQPTHGIIGENAWGHWDAIPIQHKIARNTWVSIVPEPFKPAPDVYINNWIMRDPEECGSVLGRKMLYEAPADALAYISFNEPLNRTVEQALKLGRAEVAFNTIIAAAGKWHSGFNMNAGAPELPIWEAMKPAILSCEKLILGPHLYSLRKPDGTWHEHLYTSRRYHQYPDWLCRLPIIATEGGLDQEGVGGWQAQGLTETEATVLVSALMQEWAQDKVVGAYFAIATMSDYWKEKGFIATEAMCRRWGELNRQLEFELDLGGGPIMSWDRHRVYDEWARHLGGGGFNPNTAIDAAWQRNPQWGIPLSGEIDEDPYLIRRFTNGVAYWHKSGSQAVGFARTESELPLA